MLKKVLWAGIGIYLCLFAVTAQTRALPQFVDLVEANSPAVVNIAITQSLSPQKVLPKELQSPEAEELFDEFMKRFFDFDGQGGGRQPFDSSSSGSGFIFSADGYVVTNHHVIADADEILVKLSDGRELPASVVGSDQRTDIALLKVAAKKLPVLKMGTSDKLRVGEWVLAIGSPFGFDHSATAGIVSAKGRSLPSENYVPFIQTDVAINPGNSGGPLFNLEGEVVGINSQIYSRSGGFMGVSFAIPIDVALDVIEQLKSKGVVARGWIGIYIQELDSNLAQSFGLPKPEGALVARVMPEGPAARALEPGDVVLEFDGKKVDNAATLPLLVGKTPIGKQVDLKVLRGEERVSVALTIGSLPAEDPLKTSSQASSYAPISGVLGLEVSELDTAVRQQRQLDDAQSGVLVDKVIGEPARSTGIVSGDIITMLDGKPIDSIDTFRKLGAKLAIGKTVAVLIMRDGSARFLAMKIEANARQ